MPLSTHTHTHTRTHAQTYRENVSVLPAALLHHFPARENKKNKIYLSFIARCSYLFKTFSLFVAFTLISLLHFTVKS